MVPGCPPGLFTKKFAEPPPLPTPPDRPAADRPTSHPDDD